jgi:hypothetical protein
MIPFSERYQVAASARDHNSAAVIVKEETVIFRPLARKIDHHLG